MNLRSASPRVWMSIEATRAEFEKACRGEDNHLPQGFLEGNCRQCGCSVCRFNTTLDNRLPSANNPIGFRLKVMDCPEMIPAD